MTFISRLSFVAEIEEFLGNKPVLFLCWSRMESGYTFCIMANISTMEQVKKNKKTIDHRAAYRNDFVLTRFLQFLDTLF